MDKIKEEENMSFKSGQRRLQQRLQRKLLQEAGAEKEYRRLQRKIKKEMNGARPYLYRDIEPMTLGEPICIILVFNDENEILAKAVGFTVEEVIKAMEDWLDE
jgi:hypothetical protein